MQGAGYELAFRHRTSGPRIWFNFSHDILYLYNPNYGEAGGPSRTLDRGQWNIGELSPDDIMRVQKLALGEVYFYQTEGLIHAIRLFNLNELLLVMHHRLATFELEEKMKFEVWGFQAEEGQDHWGHVETENDLWRPMDCTVADVYSTRWCDGARGGGVVNALQKHTVQKGLDEGTFWSSKAASLEEFWESQRVTVAGSGIRWGKTPKVRIVQVVTAFQEEEMIRHRQEYANRGGGQRD